MAMRVVRARWALVAAFVLAPLSWLEAGTARFDREAGEREFPVYREVQRVRMVLLSATVEDRRGRAVRGLTRDDFRLFEDRVPQEIAFVSVESGEPKAIAFLLDVSGSMRQRDKLGAAKRVVEEFARRLRPLDRVALICFADDQVAWVTPFTSDKQVFLERLAVQEGFGQTALHDAVAEVPRLVFEEPGGPHRRAIVLLTDGVDNRSRLTAEQAIEAARRVSVPIYSVGFASLVARSAGDGDVPFNLDVLRRFSEETGGRLFVVSETSELERAIAEIQEELQYQYLIGYYPTRTRWDGSFRRVQLETRNRRHTVRTRSGYYALP